MLPFLGFILLSLQIFIFSKDRNLYGGVVFSISYILQKIFDWPLTKIWSKFLVVFWENCSHTKKIDCKSFNLKLENVLLQGFFSKGDSLSHPSFPVPLPPLKSCARHLIGNILFHPETETPNNFFSDVCPDLPFPQTPNLYSVSRLLTRKSSHVFCTDLRFVENAMQI